MHVDTRARLAAQGQSRHARRRRSHRRLLLQRAAVAIAAIAVVVIVLGLALAGSPARVPSGVEVGGIDVGGLTSTEARKKLEARSRAVAARPVAFRASGRTWKLTARELDIRVNWRRAISSALHQGDG